MNILYSCKSYGQRPAGLFAYPNWLFWLYVTILSSRTMPFSGSAISGLRSHFPLLFFQIKFLNPMISRKPKLQRQRKIFKQQVKNFPRANQMNINVATWGRLLKRSSPSIQHGRNQSESPPSGKWKLYFHPVLRSVHGTIRSESYSLSNRVEMGSLFPSDRNQGENQVRIFPYEAG